MNGFPLNRAALALAILAVAGLAACGRGPHGLPASAVARDSLYLRLGGQPAIVTMVDDFAANVAADPKIGPRFAGTDMPRLKQMLVAQICAAAGGPCKYTGKDMVEAHRGMNVTSEEFDAMAADMRRTLEKFRVPERERSEMMALLGSLQGDIVGK